MPERPQHLIDRDANRRAVQFTQRDDVRDFARSAHGQNYNRMMDIQRQIPGMDRKDPLVQEFKDRRRTFNRYGKYPMGEMFGTSPLDMQDKYMDLSRDVRQTNKPVYNKMYPLTGMAMDYPSQGGLFGMIARGAGDLLGNIKTMGRDISGKVGITGAVDDTPAEQDDYVAKTFGFYPSDVHPGLTDIHPGLTEEPSLMAPPLEEAKTREEKIQEFEANDYSDVLDEAIESQWPTKDPVVFDDYVSDRLQRLRDSGGEPKDDISKYEDYIERGAQEPLPFDEGKEDFIRRQNEYVAPIPATLGTPDPQGDFDRFNKYATPDIGIEFGGDELPALPPYEGREFGLGQFMNEMPTSMKSNWEDYLEHVGRLGDMPGGGKLTYDEWQRMMRRRR